MTSATSFGLASRGFQLLLLTIAVTAAVYARSALGPLQETIRAALALSDNQVALLQGPALALPMLIFGIPLGFVVDRQSRVRLLFILTALVTIGSLLTALATNFAVLFVARGLVGVAAFAMNPAALSLVSDLYEPEKRGRANMILNVGVYGGVAVVFAFGGSLVTTSSAGLEAWRWAMLWLGVPLVPVTFLILAMREPPRTGKVIDHPTARESIAELWSYRGVVAPSVVGIVMAEISLQSVMIWAAPTLSRVFALQPDRAGAIMAIAVPLGGIVGTIAGGTLADHGQRTGGPRRTMSILIILAVLCAPAGLFAVMPGMLLAGALLTILLAILTATLVMALTLFIVVIPNELRGLCTGLLTAAGVFFSIGLAPVLVSSLSGAFGGSAKIGDALSLVCVVASLSCAAAFAWGCRCLPGLAQ